MNTPKLWCCLCVTQCELNKRLFDENGQATKEYKLVVKYFDADFLSFAIDKQNSSGIVCLLCWNQTFEFHNFQQFVFETQNRLKDISQDNCINDTGMEIDDFPSAECPERKKQIESFRQKRRLGEDNNMFMLEQRNLTEDFDSVTSCNEHETALAGARTTANGNQETSSPLTLSEDSNFDEFVLDEAVFNRQDSPILAEDEIEGRVNLEENEMSMQQSNERVDAEAQPYPVQPYEFTTCNEFPTCNCLENEVTNVLEPGEELVNQSEAHNSVEDFQNDTEIGETSIMSPTHYCNGEADCISISDDDEIDDNQPTMEDDIGDCEACEICRPNTGEVLVNQTVELKSEHNSPEDIEIGETSIQDRNWKADFISVLDDNQIADADDGSEDRKGCDKATQTEAENLNEEVTRISNDCKKNNEKKTLKSHTIHSRKLKKKSVTTATVNNKDLNSSSVLDISHSEHLLNPPEKVDDIDDDAIIKQWTYQLDCRLCNRNFDKFMLLRQHFRKKHPTETFYVICCKNKFYYRCKFAAHIRLHINPFPYKCQYCNSRFKSKYYFITHLRKHSKRPKDRRGLVQPQMDKESNNASAGEMSVVRDCSVVLEKLNTANEFKEVNAEEVIFQKLETTEGLKEMHGVFKPPSDEPHETEKTGANDGDLISNKSKQFNEDDVFIAQWLPHLKCNICNKNFQFFTPLRNHYRQQHSNDTLTIKCCDRDFKYRSALKDHIERHLNPRPFKCQVCAKAFSHRGNVITHTQVVHKIHPKNTDKMLDELMERYELPLECSYCTKIYTSVKLLRRHYRQKHPKKEFHIICCAQKLRRRSEIANHILKHLKSEKKTETT